MKSRAIVTLADSNYFELLLELLASIKKHKESENVSICVLDAGLDEKQIENISGELPLNKLAETLDSARAIEFLLNPENNYMTGTGINVTGGIHLDG